MLYDKIPTLAAPLFQQTLNEEERKTIIERYPVIHGIKYTPPVPLPDAIRKFSKGQQREDSTLRQLQYTASAILRPFDVLCHSLLPLLPEEQQDRIYTMLNDIGILVLHLCGSVDAARNNLDLRAINPSFHIPSDNPMEYTMEPTNFQEALAYNTSVQKTLREALPRRSKQVLPRDSVLGGGWSPAFESAPTFRRNPQNQKPRPQSNNSNNPFRHHSSHKNNHNNGNSHHITTTHQ